MKAVILAAGEGLRMRPLTVSRPKPMIEILGRPLLHHIFDALPDEIDEVIMVVGYLEDQIRNYFSESFGGKKITYVHQPKKLGTAHALWLVRRFLHDERFLMLYADDLQSKEDIKKCLAHPLSIMVKEVEDPRKFGVITADDNGKVLDLIEKPIVPPSNLASTGVKVLDSKIFNYPAKQHPNGEYYITDSLSQMVRDYEMFAVKADFWLPIGYPEDIKKAEDVLRARQIKEI
ncbi:MAG: nucleotidyltransferase family protein [bacterium]|nr:nucleotidyltransferase family protein [bacterium]